MQGVRAGLGGLAGVMALACMALLAPAAQAGREAPISVRVATGTQTQALKTNTLRVRVVTRRATRVRLRASVGKTLAARRTVRLERGEGRTVSLRLKPRGRQLFAGCAAQRVTVVAVSLRRPRAQARRSRSLKPGTGRCAAAGDKGAAAKTALPGCAAADAPGGEWPFYSGTLDGHREQRDAETSIGTRAVADLGTAWMTTMPDGGVIHSTPVVVDGCVYTGTDLGNVYALNADTGKVVWSQALGGGGEGSGTFEGAGIVGSPAVADGLVYAAATTPGASVLSALDQATGAIVWQRAVDEDEGGGLDSSPVPFNGMVFQAFKGDESSNHSNPGFAFLDGSREGGGRILVKTHNIPAEDFAAGYRGGSIINTPAVDLERQLVFAGTGNPVSPQQHAHTNALLKIDANPASPTFGQILGSHRGTSDSYPAPMDIDSPVCQTELQWPLGRFSCAQFDFNFLASPNLWTNSEGRQMFGGLQKSGVYTAIYTDTMEQAWQATVGIPCFGCNLSSTAVDDHGIYVAVSGGNLYSLDRDTGAVQWATPLTGSFRYNGLALTRGVLFSLNDATGTLQAFEAANGMSLFSHPFSEDTGTPMNDMGNSSGVSVARNTVFATAQADGTSTLFALKPGATGAAGDSGGEPPPPEEEPPPPDGGGTVPANAGLIATGPAAASYGYVTPVVMINKGETATYVNADAVRHNVASTDGLFRSELANTGESVTVTGTDKLEPGTYQFFCEPHTNMKGQLIVR